MSEVALEYERQSKGLEDVSERISDVQEGQAQLVEEARRASQAGLGLAAIFGTVEDEEGKVQDVGQAQEDGEVAEAGAEVPAGEAEVAPAEPEEEEEPNLFSFFPKVSTLWWDPRG